MWQPGLLDHEPPAPLAQGLKPLDFDFDLDKVYTAPPPPPPAVDPYLLTFDKSTCDEIETKWEGLPDELKYGKLRLTFHRPVSFMANRKKQTVAKKVHDMHLCKGTDSDMLLYNFSRRANFGFKFSYWDHLTYLVSIEPVPKEDMVEKVRNLANRFHPNAWVDLKEKLLDDPKHYHDAYGYTVTSITGKFEDYELEAVKRAFDERSNYICSTATKYRRKKTGRDLTVECKLDDKGIFHAWFSSLCPGGAKEDVWFLINPTTAIFKETD